MANEAAKSRDDRNADFGSPTAPLADAAPGVDITASEDRPAEGHRRATPRPEDVPSEPLASRFSTSEGARWRRSDRKE